MADLGLIIATISIITIILILLTLLLRSKSASVTVEDVPEVAAPAAPNRDRAGVIAAAANRDQDVARFIRARRARGRPVRQQVQRDSEEEEGEDEEDPLAEHMALPDGKIGAKKRKKLEMKAEKKLQRERDEEEREERKQRQISLEEERKKQEEREKRDEAKREEEEKLKKEQQEREEYEQYLKLKETFNVEEEGFDESQTEKESQSLLREFIDYVKNTKVVLVEDLAAHFRLKTQDAIDRLQSFDESGKLTGVMDDRGKFIYVSRQELEDVAKFIKQRGRVSIADVVESSNTLVNLTGCAS